MVSKKAYSPTKYRIARKNNKFRPEIKAPILDIYSFLDDWKDTRAQALAVITAHDAAYKKKNYTTYEEIILDDTPAKVVTLCREIDHLFRSCTNGKSRDLQIKCITCGLIRDQFPKSGVVTPEEQIIS